MSRYLKEFAVGALLVVLAWFLICFLVFGTGWVVSYLGL